MTFDAVGVEKFSADVDDLNAAPIHNHASAISNFCDFVSLQIFSIGKRNEFFNVVRVKDNSHAFLRFGNCKLGAVETVIFFPHSVKIDFETFSQFADSNSHAAGSEVVATFDEFRRVGISEEPLNFSFSRWIALLNFRARSRERFCSVNFA